MMQQSPHKSGRLLAIALLIILAAVLADQYTKWLVLTSLPVAGGQAPGFLDWFTTASLMDKQEQYNPVTVAPFLNFVMVWNTGISFGMFDSARPLPPAIFIGISLVISVALLVWMTLARRRVITIATALIVGGAIANIIDRLRFRAVADFIDFHIGDKHWPAFNVADSCIVIGAALLVADALLAKKEVPARA